MSTATRTRRRGFSALPTNSIGWLTLIAVTATAALTLSRLLGVESGVLVWAIAFTPYLGLASVVELIPALISRSSAVIAVAATVAALQVSWLVPAFVGSDVPRDSPADLTVMTSNLRVGHADPKRIAGLVAANRVDLLAVQEMTDESREQLRAADVDALLPYSLQDTDGNGIWSRYPLAGDGLDLSWPTVGARVDGPRGPFTFVNVHPSAPLSPVFGRWAEDQNLLFGELNSVLGPVIVAGDFNATLDHRVMRDLQAAGFTDAAEHTGAGLNPTWPTIGQIPFPLVSIDHVLYRGVEGAASDVFTQSVAGADHFAVIVRFAYAQSTR